MNCNDSAFLVLDAISRLDVTRRTFLKRAAGGIGLAALGSLLNESARAATGGLPGLPHFPPKAKRII